MKTMNKILLSASLAAFALVSCDPDPEPPSPTLPVASFTWSFAVDSTGTTDSNTVDLVSTATGSPFLYEWSASNVSTISGETASIFFQDAGTYTITHTVFNAAGQASDSTQITISSTSSTLPCTGAVQSLTDCSSKTWKLAFADSALWVGPTDGSATWWQIGVSGIQGRSCLWNDEWIFDINGSMEYKTNGDVWSEGYVDPNPEVCFNDADVPSATQAWLSGNHSFQVIEPVAPGQRTQLKVLGNGAFMGLCKVINGGEVPGGPPASSVTYDIRNIVQVGTKRYLELEINYGVGIWRFVFESED